MSLESDCHYGSSHLGRRSNGFIFDCGRIKSEFEKLGINKQYKIVIPNHPDLVEVTAAQSLKRFFGISSLTIKIISESKAEGEKLIYLGRADSIELIRNLCDSGQIDLQDVSAQDDGFHIKRMDSSFVIAGANPRGVLYGVYEFEEAARKGKLDNLNIKKVPYFRKRGSGPVYSFNKYVNLLTEDFPEEKAAYLSRMGINELTDQEIGGHLERFVKSDVFPFQTPPDADFQRKVKAMSAVCKKYGIDQYLFINAPSYPGSVGRLEDYPEEALGTVKRPWGGGKDGIEKTLCISSPIVQEHLRNVMRKLVREYPDIKGIQFYNMDGESWICTPKLCDRCKAVCTDSDPEMFNPWETQANLLTLLAKAAHEERPDFQFKVWGAVHYHGEHYEKMISAVKGFDSLMSCWNGSDRSVMIPDIAKPDFTLVTSQKLARERDLTFYAAFEFNNIESIPKSLPFPFHVCDAIKKLKRWGVKNLTEIYGLIPEHNTINAIVTREFESNPEQNVEEFLYCLATRQFGNDAGKWAYKAWEEIKKAFDVWNDMEFGPLDGSQHILSIGTAVSLAPVIISDIVAAYDGILRILTNVEPWRAGQYEKIKERFFLDKMCLMNQHLKKAAEYAKTCIDEASDSEYIDICNYEGTNGHPNCKEYAELNYAPIAIAEAICRQRCNMLKAYLLRVEIRQIHTDYEIKQKEKEYEELVLEDLKDQKDFSSLLNRFAEMRPCYTRTSLTEHEISDLLFNTEAKIDTISTYIKNL